MFFFFIERMNKWAAVFGGVSQHDDEVESEAESSYSDLSRQSSLATRNMSGIKATSFSMPGNDGFPRPTILPSSVPRGFGARNSKPEQHSSIDANRASTRRSAGLPPVSGLPPPVSGGSGSGGTHGAASGGGLPPVVSNSVSRQVSRPPQDPTQSLHPPLSSAHLRVHSRQFSGSSYTSTRRSSLSELSISSNDTVLPYDRSRRQSEASIDTAISLRTASRDATSGSGGLPLPSRQPGSGGLPLPSRSGSGGLPLPSHMSGSGGLPLPSRAGSGGLPLPPRSSKMPPPLPAHLAAEVTAAGTQENREGVLHL